MPHTPDLTITPMNITDIKSALPEYAKDIKLNLSSVLREDRQSGLSLNQIYGVALASVFATQNTTLIEAFLNDARDLVSTEVIMAAKTAATLMGMNNIYYRFIHLINDPQYQKMPAGLRMNMMVNPGVDKLDFELMSIAVSAINGCGLCIDSHEKMLIKAGAKPEGIQHAIKIAAVINGLAQVQILL